MLVTSSSANVAGVRVSAASLCLASTAASETRTLSLHDALPISLDDQIVRRPAPAERERQVELGQQRAQDVAKDRKSTRLNSSHVAISYAVFCLKKKSMDRTQRLWRWDQATVLDRSATLPARPAA